GGTRPSHAARSRPRSKLSAWPTAATRADATIAPTPGIVVSRWASSFSFAQRTNSASKAASRRSSSGPLRAGVLDEQDHAWTQYRSAPLIHQHGQELLELPLALRRDYSSLQQNGAQLIDLSAHRPTGLAIDEASACQAG